MIKEACVKSIHEALTAEKKGADRIELCAKLEDGGLTPSSYLIKNAKNLLTIPVKVMIRPRKGNFIYTKNELTKMESQIKLCKDLGINEIVMGLLTHDNTIDFFSLQRLVKLAKPMTVTFHKAIDKTPNLMDEISKLDSIPEIKGILTSGGEETAWLGKEKLKMLIRRFSHRFKIIAAGSITDDNLHRLHQYLKTEEYHGRKIVGNLN